MIPYVIIAIVIMFIGDRIVRGIRAHCQAQVARQTEEVKLLLRESTNRILSNIAVSRQHVKGKCPRCEGDSRYLLRLVRAEVNEAFTSAEREMMRIPESSP